MRPGTKRPIDPIILLNDGLLVWCVQVQQDKTVICCLTEGLHDDYHSVYVYPQCSAVIRGLGSIIEGPEGRGSLVQPIEAPRLFSQLLLFIRSRRQTAGS